MDNRVQYLCNNCNKSQVIIFTPEFKDSYLKDRDANGLALYTHIHLCAYGFLGANNLQIDHNLDVRSYRFINLPEYKKKSKLAVPGAPKIKNDRMINITHILEKNDLNIIINNKISDYAIKVGTISVDKSSPVRTIKSESEMIVVEYYYSNTMYTSQIELWFELFIDSLECLLPSKLGVVLEVLKFIMEEKKKFPSPLDKNIIQTIFASHDIFFEVISSSSPQFLSDAYGAVEGGTMIRILDIIKNDMMVQLHSLVITLKEDIVFIIYCTLLLEVHGLIKIHRPGIIKE